MGWFRLCHSAKTRLVVAPPTRALNITLSELACDTPQHWWLLQDIGLPRTRSYAVAMRWISWTCHCNMQWDHHDCITLTLWLLQSHCLPPVEIQCLFPLYCTLLCSCLHVPVQACSRRPYAVPVSSEIGFSPEREIAELQMFEPYNINVLLMCFIDAFMFSRVFISS